MVMGSAYTADTLLFNHVHRRSKRSEALEGTEYPAQVLAAHLQFTSEIAQSMSAKVEILYGVKVREEILKTQEVELLPLWADFEGITLFLAYEESYPNRDPKHVFRRIMLMASHHQHMFYTQANTDIALRQEMTLEAAVRMASTGNVMLPWVPGYYAEKKWLGTIPSSVQQREIDLLGRVISTKGPVGVTILGDDGYTDSDPEISVVEWEYCFKNTPHSNDRLRKLIPEALACLPPGHDFEHWLLPTDLPPAVLEWFQGQREIIFASVSISSLDDVVKALQHIVQQQISESCAERPLAWLLQEVLSYQRRHLATVNEP